MKVNDAIRDIVIRTGSPRMEESVAAVREFSQAVTLPLRQGIMSGPILEGVFEQISIEGSSTSEFPLDPVAPGTENQYVAYTIPNIGKIPQKHMEADYVMVPTYSIGNSAQWPLRLARMGRVDIVTRAMSVMEAGVTKKLNDDAAHLLLGTGLDRNLMVFDADANAGQLTKRLVSLAKVLTRRNGGGNSTSMNRGKLTDLWLSPEGIEDMRNWGVDQLDEVTRREMYNAPDGSLNGIYGVRLHDLDELGEDQEYQDYYLNTLGGSLASGDVELAIGLDLSKNDSFVMPIRNPWETFEDGSLHREQLAGAYGWMDCGFGALDNRRVILLSY